jgi:allophanate hydrolase
MASKLVSSTPSPPSSEPIVCADPLGDWLADAARAPDPIARVGDALHGLRARHWGDNPVWIARVDAAGLDAQLARLRERLQDAGGDASALPLLGVPFAVKDNIDAAGFGTTAGCPAFAYRPEQDAPVVARLRAAGAIVFGKSNLDQFATGLNGTRSPYGAVASAADPSLIAGGSSSGSAVAVARGEVLFALGTDTAGSGRVPAALNGLVGIKPTRGLLSSRGVVPACRSLDCVSIFAASVASAARVLAVARGFDAQDPYSRDPFRDGLSDVGAAAPLRFAVPRVPEFFGDALQQAAWRDATDRLANAGIELVSFDDAPLREAAALLYDGPWVAERDAAVGDFVRAHRDAVHPVVAAIVDDRRWSARDAFEGAYRLAALRRLLEPLWREHAAMLLPAVPTGCTIARMLADPVALNARLGTYTNFANLLDLAALNLPARPRADGGPFGVSLVGAAFSDERLLALGRRLAPVLAGASVPAPDRPEPVAADGHAVPIVVVGAHLSGLPLNGQLTERGARLLRRTRTAPRYRLFALPGTAPPRPGLVRDPAGGPIDVEIWSLPRAGWASFIEGIPPPLCIGSVETAEDGWVRGFLCEPHALAGAEEATALGGWRAYLASKGSQPGGR